MNAVPFEGCNAEIAKNQKHLYNTLPAIVFEQDHQVPVITCWELSDEELAEVVKTKRFYMSQLTFGHPFQPVRLVATLDELITTNG